MNYTDRLSDQPTMRLYHPPRRLTRKEEREIEAAAILIEARGLMVDASTPGLSESKASAALDAAIENALDRADLIGYRRHLLCELLARSGMPPVDCNYRLPGS